MRHTGWIWVVIAAAAAAAGCGGDSESSSDGGGGAAASVSSGGGGAVEDVCAGQPDSCVEVCEGGSCDCVCEGQSGAGGQGTGASGGEPTGGVGGAGTGGDPTGGAGGTGGEPTGGVGGAGTGGGPLGGSGGTPFCEDPDELLGGYLTYETQSTVTASEGAFTDECDADGNLIEYACEVSCDGTTLGGPIGGGPGVGIPCMLTPTGRVLAGTYDCGGTCVNGACNIWCPDPGNLIRMLSIDGTEMVFQNETDGSQYDCYTNADLTDPCVDPALIGQTIEIASVNSCDPAGLEAVVVFSHPDDPLTTVCSYGCTLRATSTGAGG